MLLEPVGIKPGGHLRIRSREPRAEGVGQPRVNITSRNQIRFRAEGHTGGGEQGKDGEFHGSLSEISGPTAGRDSELHVGEAG